MRRAEQWCAQGCDREGLWWAGPLKGKFNAQIAAIQGSGWGWLGYNPQTKKLDIVTTANQDPLLCKLPAFIAEIARHIEEENADDSFCFDLLLLLRQPTCP